MDFVLVFLEKPSSSDTFWGSKVTDSTKANSLFFGLIVSHVTKRLTSLLGVAHLC